MKEWEADNGEKLFMILTTMADKISIQTAFKNIQDGSVDPAWRSVADQLMTLFINDVTPTEISQHLKLLVKSITA